MEPTEPKKRKTKPAPHGCLYTLTMTGYHAAWWAQEQEQLKKRDQKQESAK